MKYALLISCLLVASCNPVKQVLRSSAKTEKVIQEYLRHHKLPKDTIVNHLPGSVITNEHYEYTPGKDSVIHDSLGIHHYFTDTVYKVTDRQRVDTIRTTIFNTDFTEALQNKQVELYTRLDIQTAATKEWRKYALWTWSLLLLVIVVWIIAKLSGKKKV